MACMAGVQATLVLLTLFIISCSCSPKYSQYTNHTYTNMTSYQENDNSPSYTNMTSYPGYDNYSQYDSYYYESGMVDSTAPSLKVIDEDVASIDLDQCNHQSLYKEVCSIADFILNLDYHYLHDELWMHLEKGYTQVGFSNIKANLEADPITMFSNLSLRMYSAKCQSLLCEDRHEVKLGELITDLIIETYTKNVRNMSAIRHDLTQIEPFEYDKSKWTMPWLKELLLRGLRTSAYILDNGMGAVYYAQHLERGRGPESHATRLTDEAKEILQTNDVDNMLKVIGKLVNNAIHAEFNLEHLNNMKESLLSRRNLPQFIGIFLREEVINKTVDCLYGTDGFFYDGKILLLQALVEVVPKDTVKNFFQSWRELLENRNDLEPFLDKIIIVVDQKIQEFDMERMLNLFKFRISDVIFNMKLDNAGGRNLFQRAKRLSKMIEKATWRLRSGLWPEMISFLDRLVLSLKTKDVNDNYLAFWKDLDNFLSTAYHEMKTEYHAALIKEFFPTSSFQLGSGHGKFWGYTYVYTYMRGLEGNVKPALSNLFVNPQTNFLSQTLEFTRKFNVVEWERWIEEHLYKFICYFIETSIQGAVSRTHWTLGDGLTALERKGFPSNLLMEDWEKIPRELEAFLEVDWQTYFVYFLHAIAETYIDNV